MSRDSYRHAVVRLRDALDLLGPYRRECLLCGRSPDARHRQAGRSVRCGSAVIVGIVATGVGRAKYLRAMAGAV